MSHPDIFVPPRRQGIWFDDGELVSYRGEPVKGIVNSTLLMEQNAPTAIKTLLPDVRLLAILRNPIDRAYSWFLKRLRDGDPPYHQGMTFEEAIKADPSIIEGGLYHVGLERFLNVFERRQLLILDYNKLEADPGMFISEIYGFVGADENYRPSHLGARSNYSTRARSNIFHQTLRRSKRLLWKLSRDDGRFIHKVESSTAVRLLARLNERIPRPMATDTRAHLAEVFAGANQRLAKMLEWELSYWQ